MCLQDLEWEVKFRIFSWELGYKNLFSSARSFRARETSVYFWAAGTPNKNYWKSQIFHPEYSGNLTPFTLHRPTRTLVWERTIIRLCWSGSADTVCSLSCSLIPKLSCESRCGDGRFIRFYILSLELVRIIRNALHGHFWLFLDPKSLSLSLSLSPPLPS